MAVSSKELWEKIYISGAYEQLSSAQARPSPSLEWILEFLPYRKVAIVDVGAGVSSLAEQLLIAGYVRPTVLDWSPAALEISRNRLGLQQASVEWVEADILHFRPPKRYALWHDRACFSFFTTKAARKKYVRVMEAALFPGGLALIAVFAQHAPARQAGLTVVGFTAHELAEEMGNGFRARLSQPVTQKTASGGRVNLFYTIFEKI